MNTQEKINKLYEYAGLEGSENGDYWFALCRFSEYLNDMPVELSVEVCKEIDICLKFIEENYELTEREVTATYKIKELEWKYE